MSLNPDDFWQLLRDSGLLHPIVIEQCQQACSKEPALSALQIAQKLVAEKLLTPYHSEILMAGRTGPFQFGNYLIDRRYHDGALQGKFRARHVPTQHGLLLTFWSGQSVQDLVAWQNVERLVESLSLVKTPFFVSVYETVVLPDYRFIVQQRPDGVTLQARLPRKARLPWRDACVIFSQVAAALESLHRREITHGGLNPSAIWVGKTGFSQLLLDFERPPDFERASHELPETPTVASLAQGADEERELYRAPELIGTTESSTAGDWYGLGCSLFRAMAGKNFVAGVVEATSNDPNRVLDLSELEKLELPEDLRQLIGQLTHADPHHRVSVEKVSDRLAKHAQKKLASYPPTVPPTLGPFRESISKFLPGKEPQEVGVPQLKIDGQNTPKAVAADPMGPIAVVPVNPSPTRSSQLPVRRKKKKWVPLVLTLGAIWAFCGLLAVGAYLASRPSRPEHDRLATQSVLDDSTVVDVDLPAEPTALATNTPLLAETLISDDRMTLWQSPTNGARLELLSLPPIPKIVMAFRPAELLNDPEGKLLLRSFGPEIGSLLGSWQERVGIKLDQFEQIVVSLHSTDDFRYQAYALCTLTAPLDSATLAQGWGGQVTTTPVGNRYLTHPNSDLAFVVLTVEEATAETGNKLAEDKVHKFGVGAPALVAQVADDPAEPVRGTLETLASQTDSLRHASLLFLRPALFNDEGQAWMGEKLLPINRELAVLLPDEIQGGCFSLHLAGGTFFELQFAHTVDLKGVEVMGQLTERFRGLRNRALVAINGIPQSSFWEGVRLKFNLMIADVFRNLRWGVEQGDVVANCWLPPMAAHNLIAASELAISFSAGSTSGGKADGGQAPAARAIPQTLEALLQTKRDLIIANPPDLNLLLSDLEKEINDDFPGLPFPFKIRLLGPDLQSEGITQNQRPGELNIRQKMVRELLTEIMVSANPAKDISGPQDPRCKLVWAITDAEGGSDEKVIVITTRNAAAQKNYELPLEFRIE